MEQQLCNRQDIIDDHKSDCGSSQRSTGPLTQDVVPMDRRNNLDDSTTSDLGSSNSTTNTNSSEQGTLHQLMISSIPQQCSEAEFKAIFAEVGEISEIKLVIDKKRNKHRGFGFVSYVDPKQAKRAIRLLNGFELYTNNIVVLASSRYQSFSTTENSTAASSAGSTA